MDRDFLQRVVPFTNSFTNVSLNIVQLQNLNVCVQKLLKVTDMGALRDMFEGDAYRRTFVMRTCAEMALEKLLGKKIIDWDQKCSDKNYKPVFIVNGVRLEVICSIYGQYPMITDEDHEKDIIIALFRVPKDVLLCGYVKMDDIKEGLKKYERNLKDDNRLGHFVSFEKLQPFSDADELEQLLKSKKK